MDRLDEERGTLVALKLCTVAPGERVRFPYSGLEGVVVRHGVGGTTVRFDARNGDGIEMTFAGGNMTVDGNAEVTHNTMEA